MTRRELIAGSAGLTLAATAAAGPPEPNGPKAPPNAVEARLIAARRGFERCEKVNQDSPVPELIQLWGRRVLDAELALRTLPAERVAALETYIRHARAAAVAVRTVYEKGAGSLARVLDAEYYRADAEALLAEEKARQAH